MDYASARAIEASEIPLIDLAPLRDGTDSRGVGQALHAASRQLGFIYLTGHGIPDAVIDNARASAYRFFRLAGADKAAIKVSSSHRGWIGQGGAKMRDDARADLKESFLWGLESPPGECLTDHPLRGPNQWPAQVPELRAHAIDWFVHAHQVAHHLMRGFAWGLGLAPDFFLRTSSRPLSRASCVWYPPQPPGLGDTQFGVAPHTDFGVLTVLCQDDVGGLQVQNAAGEWLHAPPIPGTLVVNVADLLARWTDGAYRSTPHRVVNRSGQERLSLVLAYDPDPETIIDSRAVFGPGHTPASEAITCGDYLVWRFGKAFAYRQR